MRICPECHGRTEDRTCPKCRITTVDEASLSGEDLVGRVFMERYEVLGLLGQGGMGAVYRARHMAMDSVVALKVLRREVGQNLDAIERFYREARAASRLRHPNTIRVFDFGQDEDGQMFLAMEYLEGVSLRTEMQRVGMFPEDRLLRIAGQVAASLGEAHQKGIVHRDIKPENVFLLQVLGVPDFVKVLDFGIARNLGGETMTRTGLAIGTPAYMSPEQARGEKVDGRSDLYSLGVMLFELAAGVPPFTSGTPVQLLLKHLHDPPPRLSDLRPGVSRPFEALVMDLLQKDPDARPRDAEDLLRRIAEVRGVAPAASQGVEPAATPRRGTDVAFLEQLASTDSPTTPIGAMRLPLSGEGPAPGSRSPSATWVEAPEPLVAQAGAATPSRSGGGPRALGGQGGEGRTPPEVQRAGTGRRTPWLLVPLALLGIAGWWILDQQHGGGTTGSDPGDLAMETERGATADPGVGLDWKTEGDRWAEEDGPTLDPESPQPLRAAPGPESITVRITGTPAGAVVRRESDGAVLGPLPLDLVVAPGQVHRLRVEARGYQPAELEIDWERARREVETSVRLVRKRPDRDRPAQDWEL